MSLELVPLCTATVSLAEPISVSPSLVIGEVTGARFEGDRLVASLNVRITLETDDGAVIHATYTGRLQFDTMAVYATPLFHTGDERYQWLNRIQVVAKGAFTDPGTLIYEMYELR
jgi:hypothetical protein